MLRPRVLVVTDDAVAAEAIRATLMAEGYDVDTTSRSAEALGQFAQYPYDLLIASLRLPDGDGPGLYWGLRDRWPSAYPRVLFLLQAGDPIPPSGRGLAGPAAPVLPVPFTPEALREIVRRALGAL